MLKKQCLYGASSENLDVLEESFCQNINNIIIIKRKL